MSTTKKFWSYTELVTKVRRDMDLLEEEFIGVDEMLGYLNEAIDDCEEIVNTLYKDYFLAKRYTVAMVPGVDEYAAPPRIYADAIRRVIFRNAANGSKDYQIRREQDWHKFETYTYDRVNSNATLYSYFLSNDGPADVSLLITPVPVETGLIDIWYIRQANRIILDDNADRALAQPIVFATILYGALNFTADTQGYLGNEITLVFDGVADADAVIGVWNAANPTNTVSHDGVGTEVLAAASVQLENGGSDRLDIPEAHNYVMKHMKVQCALKESGGAVTPSVQLRMAERLRSRESLEGTLAARTPDANNRIEPDFTNYQELS